MSKKVIINKGDSKLTVRILHNGKVRDYSPTHSSIRRLDKILYGKQHEVVFTQDEILLTYRWQTLRGN